MGLRTKVAMIVTLVLGALLAGNLAIQAVAVYPSFEELENREAVKDWERCRDAIEREIGTLLSLNTDWAFWDDTQQYMLGRLPEYFEHNLANEQWFIDQNIDALILVQPDGVVQWGRTVDGSATPAALHLLPTSQFPPDHPLMQVTDDKQSSRAGLIRTEHGPMMVVASPILSSQYEPPRTGVLIFGRYLDAETLDPMIERMQINFTARPMDDADLTAPQQRMAAAAIEADEPRVTPSDDHLTVVGVLTDLFEQPMLMIRTEFPRAITAHGARAISTATLTQAGAGLATLVVLVLLLHFVVVRPLLHLSRHVARIGEDGRLQARLNLRRGDEIGRLADGFDRMMGQLDDSRRQALDLSREAGMAEVATGVLHNVGNVLNSVNVSADVIHESLRESRLATLGKFAGLVTQEKHRLGEFVTQDPRGQCMPEFLEKLHEKLRDDQDALQKEVEQLLQSIDHIKHVVRLQQSTATRTNFAELVEPAALFEDALKVNMVSIERSNLTLRREFEPGLPRVSLDRHKVLQILINLLSNAKKATRPQEIKDPCITLRLHRVDDGRSIRFQVQDNGVGIEPANLTRIFNQGFSCFKNGHGFGLHSGANAAGEMNGRLTVHSDGPGRGALFSLTLPIVADHVAAEHAAPGDRA